MKIGDQAVGECEFIGGENEFIGPSVLRFQVPVGAYGRFHRTEYGCADRTDVLLFVFGLVYPFAQFLRNDHLFRLHLMLCQIFHIDHAIGSQSIMEREITEFNVSYFHPFHQFAAEMQAGGGSDHCPLMLRKYILVSFHIFGLRITFQVFRDGSLPDGK